MAALTDLALMWAAVYFAVGAARKTRLTPVLFFLFMGFVMVNVGLLPIEPHPFIRGFAELGIIVIMFALGFEESSSNFVQSAKKSWGIALFGAVTPFVIAYSIADYFWADSGISMMCGLAMTATAVSLTMVSLKSEGLARTLVATRIMTSAVLDDIGSLALVAILVPMVTGDQATGVQEIGLIVLKVVAFFALIWFVASWLLPHEIHGRLGRIPIIRNYGARQVLSFGGWQYATLTVLLMCVVAGILAHYFGFHPAVGAYMAGLILREEYFENREDRHAFRDTRRILDSAAFAWIGPVFFVQLGTQLVLDRNIVLAVIPETLMLTVGLFIGQIASASLAARYTSGMNARDSLLVGFGMLGRAELAFVVMDIAYVQNHILSTEAFYTLMFTAFWLNVSVPVTITLWKRRFGGNYGFKS